MKPARTVIAAATALALISFKSGNTCESFFPQNPGTKWETTSYNEKDKVLSVSKSELLSIADIDGGIEATIKSDIYDDKQKLLNSGEVKMQCTNDHFYMDMSGMFNSAQMAGIEGAEINMTNEFMEFPSNPVAGQMLADASSTMTMSLNGMQVMSMTINITNRKVEGTETITTPAGTFVCMKFSEDTETKSMMMNNKGHSVMWLSRNVGMIKVESWDEKGKLQSKNVLTSFSAN